jgi:hypothetical protein
MGSPGMFSVVFLSVTRQIPGLYFKLGHNSFLLCIPPLLIGGNLRSTLYNQSK